MQNDLDNHLHHLLEDALSAIISNNVIYQAFSVTKRLLGEQIMLSDMMKSSCYKRFVSQILKPVSATLSSCVTFLLSLLKKVSSLILREM